MKTNILSPVQLRIAVVVYQLKASTGRTIAKQYRLRVGRRISYGTLYTGLKRLINQGFITQGRSSGDGRERDYVLTQKGKKTIETSYQFYVDLVTLVETAP